MSKSYDDVDVVDEDEPVEPGPTRPGLLDFSSPKAGWLFIAAFTAAVVTLGLMLT